MRRASVIYDRAMHEARKHWRERLGALSFEAGVGLDHPRPRDGQGKIRPLGRVLDDETSTLLYKVAGASPFLRYTVLLVGLQVCLSRCSGKRAVTVLCPAPTRPEVVPNLLPVDGTVESAASFRELLVAAKDRLSEAFRHPQYPFSSMLLDLPEESRPAHLPPAAAMAGFNDAFPDLDGGYDLRVLFEADGETVEVTLHFDPRLYEEASLDALLRTFGSLLGQGLAAMKRPLRELPDEGNGDEAPPWQGPSLRRQFEAHAAEDPQRVALFQGETSTSYGDLDHQADRLAERLSALGLDRRRPIALLLETGPASVVATLAALKSGHVFAPLKLLALDGPLDELLELLAPSAIVCRPEHLGELEAPAERLESLRHVITAASSTGGPDAASLGFSLAWSRQEGEPTGEEAAGTPEGEASEEDPSEVACVLVGREDSLPVLSPVTHAELGAAFGEVNARLGLGEEDRCLLSPGLAPCDQLYDTLGILSVGASVEIPEAGGLQDPSALLENLFRKEITVWNLPAALAQNLLAEISSRPPEAGGGPRCVLLTGEKQSLTLAHRLREHFPRARVLGVYAPPALGFWSTLFPLGDEVREGALPGTGGTVTAEALPGFAHRLLNASGDPAPAPSRGELHLERGLGGAGPVATGLRGRRTPEGPIAWLRGPDHRFRKWGCTVELTPIEEILSSHEGVAAAEVISLQGEEGSRHQVVAFAITEGTPPSPEEVRDFLVEHRDVDLIPDRIVLLEEFPLAVDGALDRALLLQRFLGTDEGGGEALGAEDSEIQRQLQEIWLEALQLDEVGDEASFFKLGGNSLKATLLIARIRDRFSVDLSVQDFFREPSLRAVARLIEAEVHNAGRRQEGPGVKVVSREKYRVQMPELEG